ncbi:MAG TPA: hypothetical protein VIM41_13630 [Gammaproteobacteria bacterium]
MKYLNLTKLLPVGLVTVALAALLAACNTTNPVHEEKLQQDEFLERNFRAEPPDEKEKPALKTEFYNEIQAGEVVVGMSLLEALVATRTYPHGPNRYNMVYWCAGQMVDSCNATCAQCSATLLTPRYTHYLQGKGDTLAVVKSLTRHAQDNIANLRAKPYPVVNALFLNRIVPGMGIEDFQRIEQLPHTKTQYYCKDQRVFQSCLLSCSDCTLKLIAPRGERFHVQTVRFRGTKDYATVFEVQETLHARNP